jgi:hypothetical protein
MISVFKGSDGYDVAYRIDENKIYKGSGGYDVAYTISGNNIHANAYGYGDVAYRIDGNKIYKGADGYSVAYRIGYEGEQIKKNTPEEKSGCIGMIVKFIAFCIRLFKTWSGRVGMLLGVAAGIAVASNAHDFMNALFLGIIFCLLFLFIGGGLGTLVGFIFRKSSKAGKFGGLIGAGALALAGVILGLIEQSSVNNIIMVACVGLAAGWIAGTIIGAIVGLIMKKSGKKKE